jgi:hypothetical protein
MTKMGDPGEGIEQNEAGQPLSGRRVKRMGKKRTRNLRSNGLERRLEVLTRVDHPDSLSSSTLRSLDHDGVPNLLRPLDSILERLHARRLVRPIWNGDEALGRHLRIGNARTRPRHAGDVGVLGDDGGGDLVSEGTHGGAGGTDENDLVGGSSEGFRKSRVFRGMSPMSGREEEGAIGLDREEDPGRQKEGREREDNVPSSPDGVNARSLSDIDNEVDVGVVVVVGSSGDLNESIGHSDVVGVDFPAIVAIESKSKASAGLFM